MEGKDKDKIFDLIQKIKKGTSRLTDNVKELIEIEELNLSTLATINVVCSRLLKGKRNNKTFDHVQELNDLAFKMRKLLFFGVSDYE